MMTLTLPDQTSIDPGMIDRMIGEFGQSRGVRRATIAGELLRIGVHLNALRSQLGERLDTGFEYLEQHAARYMHERLGLMASDADPDRERIWMEWLRQFETCHDLLARIERDVVPVMDVDPPAAVQAEVVL